MQQKLSDCHSDVRSLHFPHILPLTFPLPHSLVVWCFSGLHGLQIRPQHDWLILQVDGEGSSTSCFSTALEKGKDWMTADILVPA